MNMIIKKIELSNIQVHEHFVFVPDQKGITAIRGANGTGKSTIVDSIAWGMYGTKPPGVSKAVSIYRDGATFPQDKCFVRIWINIDGRDLRIERRMMDKHGKTECNVWEEFNADGKTTESHQAGPAVSHAETYIRKTLKMDEKGFLTAILIQQKQVDKLISATARERAQAIEQLTGISSITNAVAEARQEFNNLNKKAKEFNIDEDGFKTLQNEKEKLIKDLDAKKVSKEKTFAKNEEFKKLSSELHEKVEEEDAKIQKNEETKERLTVLKTRIEGFEENLAVAIQEKDEKKKQLSQIAVGVKLDEITESLGKKKQELRQLTSSQDYTQKEIDKAVQKLQEYSTIVEKAGKTLEEAEGGLNKAANKADEISKSSVKNREEIISLNTEVKKLDRAMKVLEHENGDCPTCLQHVDDVSSVVSVLQSQKDEILTKITECENKIDQLVQMKEKTEAISGKFEILVSALTQSETITASLKTLRKEKEDLQANIVVLESEVSTTEKHYNEARRQSEVKEEYDRLLSRAQKIAEHLEKMKGESITFQSEVKSAGVITSSALAKLRKRYEDVSENSSDLALQYSNISGDVRVMEEQVKSLDLAIDRQHKEITQYKELLKSVETSKATVSVLEEFRIDRINNSIPVIESYASDLINRFTDGKFVGLKMDSKFNAKVTLANGKERAVGSLSGGELSLASIALLVSISMLLNSAGGSNPIILDEVFVSQDANRADLSISTIKEVCQGQLIMIAHNESLDSVADKVVQLS